MYARISTNGVEFSVRYDNLFKETFEWHNLLDGTDSWQKCSHFVNVQLFNQITEIKESNYNSIIVSKLNTSSTLQPSTPIRSSNSLKIPGSDSIVHQSPIYLQLFYI